MFSRRIQLLGLGIVISTAFLYLALRSVDWRALGQTLLNIQIEGLALCMGMITLSIVLRGWRWRLIAGRSTKLIMPFIRATNLGILGNQLLPARLGEVIRVAALKRILQTGISESLGSALIDRIFDALILFVSAWLVSTFLVGTLLPQGWFLTFGAALALLGVGFLIIRTDRFHTWVTAVSERNLHRWSLHPDSFVRAFNAMIRHLTQFRSGSSVVVVALLVWLADYLAVLAALLSIGLHLPAVAPLFLWVMLAAGSALPAGPGYAGIYQLAAVLALGTFDVPAHQAVAVSLVLQGVTLLVSITLAGSEVKQVWSSSRNFHDDADQFR